MRLYNINQELSWTEESQGTNQNVNDMRAQKHNFRQYCARGCWSIRSFVTQTVYTVHINKFTHTQKKKRCPVMQFEILCWIRACTIRMMLFSCFVSQLLEKIEGPAPNDIDKYFLPIIQVKNDAFECLQRHFSNTRRLFLFFHRSKIALFNRQQHSRWKQGVSSPGKRNKSTRGCVVTRPHKDQGASLLQRKVPEKCSCRVKVASFALSRLIMIINRQK